MMLARALRAAAILGFMAHPALAQAVPEQDQEFAQKAAEGGLIEVQLGQLAHQQAKDQQVVHFGQRMVQDHGQANDGHCGAEGNPAAAGPRARVRGEGVECWWSGESVASSAPSSRQRVGASLEGT
jgi:hypothetical protein